MITFWKNKKTMRSGFTFGELTVVILVIALISTVSLASINTIRRSARDKKILSITMEFKGSLEAYRLVEGSYPDADVVLAGESLVGPRSGVIFYDKTPDNVLYYYDRFNDRYGLQFCLEGPLDSFVAGDNCMIGEETLGQSCEDLFLGL